MTANKRIKQGVMYAILILLSIYTLFPIYFLIVNSFKSQKEIVGSPISVPSSFDFSYLKNAAAQIRLGESVVNTLIITVVAVALIVVISIPHCLDDGKKQDQSKQLSVPLLYRSNADSVPVRYVSAGKPDGSTGT